MIDPQTIVFRAAGSSDAGRIAALFTDEGYPAGASDIVARLGRFTLPSATVVVAESGGEVLGFVAVHVIPRFDQDDCFLRILALVVDPGVRERGLGRLLMAEAERIGRTAGASFVEITAGHHRPEARRLYEALGYDSGVTSYLRRRI